MGSYKCFCLGYLGTRRFLRLASQGARITDVNHQCQATISWLYFPRYYLLISFFGKIRTWFSYMRVKSFPNPGLRQGPYGSQSLPPFLLWNPIQAVPTLRLAQALGRDCFDPGNIGRFKHTSSLPTDTGGSYVFQLELLKEAWSSRKVDWHCRCDINK
jgi:hypothetical protein